MTALFPTITDEHWRRGLASARLRRKSSQHRTFMQAFLSRVRQLMPGITFTLVADVGGGPANVTTIPAERVPNEVALWAEWTETGTNQKRRAEMPMSRVAITTNPRLFAESVAGQVSQFVKGGAA